MHAPPPTVNLDGTGPQRGVANPRVFEYIQIQEERTWTFYGFYSSAWQQAGWQER